MGQIPQNNDFEQSILSTMLIDSNAAIRIADEAKLEYFFNPFNKTLFLALREAVFNQEPLDAVAMSHKISSNGNQAKNLVRLTSLMDVPVVSDISYYLKELEKLWHKRNLLKSSQSVIDKCYDPKSDVDEIITIATGATTLASVTDTEKQPIDIDSIVERAKTISETAERNGFQTLSTGLMAIDSITNGLHNKDFIILAARPRMGKTSLALNIAEHAACNQGVPVAIFSLEMGSEQLVARMLCGRAGISYYKFMGGHLRNGDWEKINDAAAAITGGEMYIDDDPALTPSKLMLKARRLKEENDIGLLIVDYIQLMSSESTSERRELDVAGISRSMKILAKDLNIPVLALSQLNRDLEKRKDKRPILSDLRESGTLEQDSDMIWFLHRESVYQPQCGNGGGNQHGNNNETEPAELLVAKHRNGPTGVSDLLFHNSRMKFTDLNTRS